MFGKPKSLPAPQLNLQEYFLKALSDADRNIADWKGYLVPGRYNDSIMIAQRIIDNFSSVKNLTVTLDVESLETDSFTLSSALLGHDEKFKTKIIHFPVVKGMVGAYNYITGRKLREGDHVICVGDDRFNKDNIFELNRMNEMDKACRKILRDISREYERRVSKENQDNFRAEEIARVKATQIKRTPS